MFKFIKRKPRPSAENIAGNIHQDFNKKNVISTSSFRDMVKNKDIYLYIIGGQHKIQYVGFDEPLELSLGKDFIIDITNKNINELDLMESNLLYGDFLIGRIRLFESNEKSMFHYRYSYSRFKYVRVIRPSSHACIHHNLVNIPKDHAMKRSVSNRHYDEFRTKYGSSLRFHISSVKLYYYLKLNHYDYNRDLIIPY
jgi:hypothetical protein